MDKFCHSCGIPLSGKDGEQYRGSYCLYCSDEKGNLHPREAVQQGIAGWLGQIAPGVDQAELLKRAGYYMQAMPAWAK